MSEGRWDPPPDPGAPEPDRREGAPAPEPDWRAEREPAGEGPAEPIWTRLREAPSRLTFEQKLAGAGAIGIVLSLFLPWWHDPLFGGDHKLSYSGLNRFGWIELSLLLIAGSVLLTLFRRAEGRVFHLPLSDGTLAAGAGLWCCGLLIARVIGEPTRHLNGKTYGYDPRWGLLFCFLCSATLALAGVMGRQRHHRGEPEALAADEDANATFTG